MNQLLAVITLDSSGDGTIETTEASTVTYNKEGDPVLQIDEIDFGLDGTNDQRLVSFWDYDFANHQIIYTQDQDWNADGINDTHSRLVYTLGTWGQPISWDGYIGNPHRPSGRVFSSGAYTYDSFGNLTQLEAVITGNGGSGVSRFFTRTSYFYARRSEIRGTRTNSLNREDESRPRSLRSPGS
jgi:hypothetical protein